MNVMRRSIRISRKVSCMWLVVWHGVMQKR
jgi:hypothetical protein